MRDSRPYAWDAAAVADWRARRSNAAPPPGAATPAISANDHGPDAAPRPGTGRGRQRAQLMALMTRVG